MWATNVEGWREWSSQAGVVVPGGCRAQGPLPDDDLGDPRTDETENMRNK